MIGLETAGAIASIVTTIVTAATLIVLIWYTVETQKLRREAQSQNEHSTTPIVMFQTGYFPPHTKYSGLVVRNLGPGPAFNVHIRPITVLGKLVTFNHSRVLAPGQCEFVALSGLRDAKRNSYGGYDDGEIHHSVDLQQNLKSDPDSKETKGAVEYTSTSGKKYRTTFTIDHNSDGLDSLVTFDGMHAL